MPSMTQAAALAESSAKGSEDPVMGPTRSGIVRAAVPAALAVILGVGLWVRLAQQDHFFDNPRYWSVTGYHLANSRAVGEGEFFRFVPSDATAAHQFLARDGAYRNSLAEYDAGAIAARALGDPNYSPYILDQGGWGVFIFLARKIPGVDSISDICRVQILLDLLALLLLFPIGLFVTNSRVLSLLLCALYAVYLPQAYAVAEPFREGWPTLAAIFSTALMIPLWKRGPAAFPRTIGWALAAGVVCGLLTYGRSTVVVLPMALAVITFLCWRKPWRSSVVGATVVASMLVVLAPWMAFAYSHSGHVSLTSSGSGHSLFTGMGEDATDNPTGILFDDGFTHRYVTQVCGYPVEYGSYEYSAACKTEAYRFIADSQRWYRGLLWERLRAAVYPEPAGLAHWGILPQGHLRKDLDWTLHFFGSVGLLVGIVFFARGWLALVWVLQFWAFILPFQSHPRLLLGADWAVMLGLVMLLGSIAKVAHWAHRTWRGGASDRGAPQSVAETQPAPSSPWPLRLTAIAAFGIDLTVLVLLQAFGPETPAPTHDWRARMRDADAEVRLATIDSALRHGLDARPIFVAGLRDSDRRVRNAARSAILAFEHTASSLALETQQSMTRELEETVLLRRYDFADGTIPQDLRLAPGVAAQIVPDSHVAGGHFLRITAEGTEVQQLLDTSWPRERAGEYVVRLGVRGARPVTLRFSASSDPRADRTRPLAVAKATSSYPPEPEAFRPAVFSYAPESGEQVRVAIFEDDPEGAAAPTTQLDLDWLEVRQFED